MSRGAPIGGLEVGAGVVMGTTVWFFPVQRPSGQQREWERPPPATNAASRPLHTSWNTFLPMTSQE